MEQCECLPLNSKFARKSVFGKTKPFNRQTVISINQSFKVLSTGKNTCPVNIQDVDDLKQRLISVWAEFKHSVIDKAIDQWRPRLRACVLYKSIHFPGRYSRKREWVFLSEHSVYTYTPTDRQTTLLYVNIPGGAKKRNPCFNFGITSVNVYRF